MDAKTCSIDWRKLFSKWVCSQEYGRRFSWILALFCDYGTDSEPGTIDREQPHKLICIPHCQRAHNRHHQQGLPMVSQCNRWYFVPLLKQSTFTVGLISRSREGWGRQGPSIDGNCNALPKCPNWHKNSSVKWLTAIQLPCRSTDLYSPHRSYTQQVSLLRRLDGTVSLSAQGTIQPTWWQYSSVQEQWNWQWAFTSWDHWPRATSQSVYLTAKEQDCSKKQTSSKACTSLQCKEFHSLQQVYERMLYNTAGLLVL